MFLHIHLLLAAVIAGLCGGTKSESYIFGLSEIEECLQSEPLTRNCLGEACVLQKCLKLGYDLLFENSSYSLKGNHEVSRTAHCAIDKCVKSVMEGNYDIEGLFS
ncbi:uncharacterized protein DAT39_023587, partial [Clarias magur]